MYRQYGDTRLLEDHYEAMKRYVDYENNRLNPTTGLSTSSLGDWAAPGHAQQPGPEGAGLTATAYVWRANDLIAKIAGALGDSADQAQYADRASQVADDLNAAFLDTGSGTYNTQIPAGYRQTSNVLPLAWDLVPAGQRADVFDGLVDDVEVTREGHLNTGVIGTKYLLRVLTREGRADLADVVANQRTYPSWGLWFDNGATTPFEFWELDSRSRGHMFLGTIVDWLYVDVAGLDAGDVGATRHLTVKPTLLESLDHASATTETIFGQAGSSWSRDGDAVDVEVDVPVGTTATVRLPAEDIDDVGEGSAYVRNADGVASAAIVDGEAVIEVESGSYRFRLDEEFTEEVADLALSVRPRKKKVTPGKQARFTARLANVGDATADQVEVCAKAPKRRAKVAGRKCFRYASLAESESETARFRVKAKRKAAGKRVPLRFIATAANADRQFAKATLKVKKKKRRR